MAVELEGWEEGILADAQEIEDRFAVEFLEAQPTWHPGMVGLEVGKPVWALVYSTFDYDNPFRVVRGKLTDDTHTPFEHFDPTGREDSTKHVYCWADCESEPKLSPAMVEAVIAGMAARVEDHSDDTELEHSMEDWLRDKALRAVCKGHPVGVAIARAVLKTSDLKITRYYA